MISCSNAITSIESNFARLLNIGATLFLEMSQHWIVWISESIVQSARSPSAWCKTPCSLLKWTLPRDGVLYISCMDISTEICRLCPWDNLLVYCVHYLVRMVSCVGRLEVPTFSNLDGAPPSPCSPSPSPVLLLLQTGSFLTGEKTGKIQVMY